MKLLSILVRIVAWDLDSRGALIRSSFVASMRLRNVGLCVNDSGLVVVWRQLSAQLDLL